MICLVISVLDQTNVIKTKKIFAALGWVHTNLLLKQPGPGVFSFILERGSWYGMVTYI